MVSHSGDGTTVAAGHPIPGMNDTRNCFGEANFHAKSIACKLARFASAQRCQDVYS